jgi:hypothetical protein
MTSAMHRTNAAWILLVVACLLGGIDGVRAAGADEFPPPSSPPDEPAAVPPSDDGGPAADEPAAARPPEPPPAAPSRPLDEVTLFTGAVFEGWITHEDARSVVLELPSECGGSGKIQLPRERIRAIRRATDPRHRSSPEDLRDAWFLLQSGGRIVGTRRLSLRRVTTPDGPPGWMLEERLTHFGHGPHVPEIRIEQREAVDLIFRPLRTEYREVGEAPSHPSAPGRYERFVLGNVERGTWRGRSGNAGDLASTELPLPDGVRGRLGTREDLLRRRETGLGSVTFLETSGQRLATARAGYSALDLSDGQGGTYDEFVWEEGGRRLTTRLAGGRILSEEVAEGVVAIAASEAQAQAAQAGANDPTGRGTGEAIVLPEVGLAFELPGPSWSYERVERSPSASGPRVVGRMSTPIHVADVRIEWDPDGAAAAPGFEEGRARLFHRLRAVCPDLAVVEVARRVEGLTQAWRVTMRGTLKGESVYTVAVVVDRGPSRTVFLCACPEASWDACRESFDAFAASLRSL